MNSVPPVRIQKCNEGSIQREIMSSNRWLPTDESIGIIVLIELNNKYALDGRDPNSYSGIFWVLGRYDRPWGPERPIFGKIRYMSSKNTARKVRVQNYKKKYSI